MKGSTFILIIIFVLLYTYASPLNGEFVAETEGIRVYDVDYIDKYEKTLNAMFNNDWTIISTEEKYEEHDEICGHVDTRPQQFIEWTIEYSDGNGELRTFAFDNRQSLSPQVQYYVKNLVAEYYKEAFFNVYLKDIPLAPSSYVFCFFLQNFAYSNYEDIKDMTDISRAYLERLETPEGAICLSNLTPSNVFEICPVYLSVNVSISEYPDNKQRFEEAVMLRIENMIEDMNKFSRQRLTASLSMGYHEIIDLHTGTRKSLWTYVQGKEIFNTAGSYFDRDVFEGYRGIFW